IACILVAPGEAGPSGTVARKRGGGAVRPRRGQGWNAITKRRSTPPDSAQKQALARPEGRCPTVVGWHAGRPPRPLPASGYSATASGSIPTAGAASAATGLRPRGRPFPPPSQGRAALPWHPPLAPSPLTLPWAPPRAPSPGRGRRASPRRPDCSGAVRPGARAGAEHRPHRLGVRPLDHALLGDDGVDQRGRGDVEHRVP